MNNTNTVETFLDLVQIDSPSGDEQNVRKYIESRFDKLSLKYSSDKYGNLLAKKDGAGGPLLLCAHMDTVEPGRGIKPVIKNGIITSDGSTILGADNKLAIAAILAALDETKHIKSNSLEILFTVREETDGGINQFDFTQLKAKEGLIADRASDIGSIVLSSPWITNLYIDIYGKAVHAGTPEKGINALLMASEMLQSIKIGRVDEFTTCNFGLIRGGEAMNSVPEKISLTGEVRSFREDNLLNTLQLLENTFKRTTKKYHGKIAINKENYCRGYVYGKGDKNIATISNVFKELAIKPKYEISFGGSDANTLITHKVMAVNIGDGGKDPHTLNESVTVENLEKLKNVFINYIKI